MRASCHADLLDPLYYQQLRDTVAHNKREGYDTLVFHDSFGEAAGITLGVLAVGIHPQP